MMRTTAIMAQAAKVSRRLFVKYLGAFIAGTVGGSWYLLGTAIGELIKRGITGSTMTVLSGGGVAER